MARPPRLAFEIRPQQSTQYGQMTSKLAEPELRASPIAPLLEDVEQRTIAGREYLLASTRDGVEVQHDVAPVVARLGATSELFEYFDSVGDVSGPLLRPVSLELDPFVPIEMAETRRYKGKTNDVFTHVLLNVALFAGSYAGRLETPLRILDPLAGGGTTLFLALAHGYHAFGIELNRNEVERTAQFTRQYFREARVAFRETRERPGGKLRFRFEVGRQERRVLALMHGDTRDAPELMHGMPGGVRVHAVVGDLPYGIQHFGELRGLLEEALPRWAELLLPGGTIALSWNATRVSREQMLAAVDRVPGLEVRTDERFGGFAHRVDRVIRERDVVVAVAPTEAPDPQRV